MAKFCPRSCWIPEYEIPDFFSILRTNPLWIADYSTVTEYSITIRFHCNLWMIKAVHRIPQRFRISNLRIFNNFSTNHQHHCPTNQLFLPSNLSTKYRLALWPHGFTNLQSEFSSIFVANYKSCLISFAIVFCGQNNQVEIKMGENSD